MDVPRLLEVLYLGDAGCLGLCVDGPRGSVSIHMSSVARVENPGPGWDFKRDEEILDGRLVFAGVRHFSLSPAGPLPNDSVESPVVVEERLQPQSGRARYVFAVNMDSIDQLGRSTLITATIEADDLYVEDPRAPGVAIRWCRIQNQVG